MKKWKSGPPPKEAGKFWLVEFDHGDRFNVVKYRADRERFEDQNDFGFISDPMIAHLEIPEPRIDVRTDQIIQDCREMSRLSDTLVDNDPELDSSAKS